MNLPQCPSFSLPNPCFWIRTCSQDIFKSIKGTNSSVKTVEHLFNDISRRWSSDGIDVRENFNEQRKIDFPASASGFCHKYEKIISKTVPANKIFRPKNRYSNYSFGTNRERNGKGNFEESKSPFSPSNHCFGINKFDSSDVLNCTRSSASSSTAKLFIIANTIPILELFIPGKNSIKQY